MNQFYLLIAYGCLEMETVGPFASQDLRDRRARELRKEQDENDAIWWLDLIDRELTAGDYSGAFFMEDGSNET